LGGGSWEPTYTFPRSLLSSLVGAGGREGFKGKAGRGKRGRPGRGTAGEHSQFFHHDLWGEISVV